MNQLPFTQIVNDQSSVLLLSIPEARQITSQIFINHSEAVIMEDDEYENGSVSFKVKNRQHKNIFELKYKA